jgi:two-component system, cell cycle sensor histidine kinase and response regulator CckA
VLQVSDSGPGIPAEYHEKIFEPFFSLKKGSDRSGSGLGLAIVTAVVDDHRGVLDLETGPAGTMFTLYLPAHDAPAAASEPKPLYELVTEVEGDVTVLVVDDDAAARAWCAKILEEAGYHVVTADDGADAIRLMQMEQVDALLLDLKMPHLSGFDTFFGALHLQPGVRAIVHSSYVSDADSLRLRQHGVSAVLTKPAGRREILGALRDAFADRPLAPAAAR